MNRFRFRIFILCIFDIHHFLIFYPCVKSVATLMSQFFVSDEFKLLLDTCRLLQIKVLIVIYRDFKFQVFLWSCQRIVNGIQLHAELFF